MERRRLVVSAGMVRRLFIRRQRLAGPRPAADAPGLLETVRDLGCVQLDPISAVDAMDRETGRLLVHAVHAEKQGSPGQGRAVAGAIEELGAFLGARTISYGRRIAAVWRPDLVGTIGRRKRSITARKTGRFQG